jgi:hypothetical protein
MRERRQGRGAWVLHELSGLGVQSRSEVGWIVSESDGLFRPDFADMLVGSEATECLEAFGEVVR